MTTETKTVAQRQLPVPISREIHTVKGITYEKFVFSTALNFKAAVEFAESMKEQGYKMIEIKMAREIRDDSESNASFRKVLNGGEWTYIHDEKSESRSLAAYLVRNWFSWWVYVGDDYGPDKRSQVVVLEKTGGEAGTSQEQPRFLRLDEKREVLEVTQGGNTILLENVSKARAVKRK
jgi:hypothetical protein